MPGDPSRERIRIILLMGREKGLEKLYYGRATPRLHAMQLHAMLYECTTAWTPISHCNCSAQTNNIATGTICTDNALCAQGMCSVEL